MDEPVDGGVKASALEGVDAKKAYDEATDRLGISNLDKMKSNEGEYTTIGPLVTVGPLDMVDIIQI